MKNRKQLLNRIEELLARTQWGSVEIYVQNGKVVQITNKHIEKTQEVEV